MSHLKTFSIPLALTLVCCFAVLSSAQETKAPKKAKKRTTEEQTTVTVTCYLYAGNQEGMTNLFYANGSDQNGNCSMAIANANSNVDQEMTDFNNALPPGYQFEEIDRTYLYGTCEETDFPPDTFDKSDERPWKSIIQINCPGTPPVRLIRYFKTPKSAWALSAAIVDKLSAEVACDEPILSVRVQKIN